MISSDVRSLVQLAGDGTDLTMANRPQERMLDWFFEPLLTLKEQLRLANLTEVEEHYLEKLVLMVGDTQRMLDWDNGGVEPVNDIRRGELQALSRRYLLPLFSPYVLVSQVCYPLCGFKMSEIGYL